VEYLFAAHPRTAVLVNDALYPALAPFVPDAVERAAPLEALYGTTLRVRISGTVHARDGGRDVTPLAFVLRGGAAELLAVVDVTAGPVPPRAVRAPSLELVWQPAKGRETTPGAVAAIVSALYETTRRWGPEALLRAASAGREARPTHAVLVDAIVDTRLALEGARFVFPLRSDATDADARRLGVDLALRLADAASGDAAVEWSATVTFERRNASPVAIAGVALLRELVARWARAVRVLPRYFPVPGAPSSHYARAAAVESAAALGVVTAVLRERGIPEREASSPELRSRLSGAAAEVLATGGRELAALLPLRPSAREGADCDVLERALMVAWFLQANFCTNAPGAVQWVPPGGTSVLPYVQEFVERAGLKAWIAGKTARPEAVELRMQAVLDALEPSIMVDDQ
jgi:hypothetical protein